MKKSSDGLGGLKKSPQNKVFRVLAKFLSTQMMYAFLFQQGSVNGLLTFRTNKMPGHAQSDDE